MPAYTHYWSQSTVADHKGLFEGKPLVHTAGNRLGRVARGDVVYVISAEDGDVILIGRMLVESAGSEDQIRRFLKKHELMKDASSNGDLWDAAHHLAARPESATLMSFDRRVPFEQVREELTFRDARGDLATVKITSAGKLDRQTLRGCRELSWDGQSLLDRYL